MTITDATNAAQAASARAKADATRRAILDALARYRTGGASNRWLTSATGRSKSTINRAVRGLVADGLVRATQDPADGRTPRYSLASKAAR